MGLTKEAPAARDLFSQYRIRTLYWVGIVGAVFLLPSAIRMLTLGQQVGGVAMLAVGLLFAANALAIQQNKSPPVPYALFVPPIAAAIIVLARIDAPGHLFWCYPALLFFYLVLPRRAAHLCALALVAAVAWAAQHDAGALRWFLFSIMLSASLVSILLNTVGQLQRGLSEHAITDPLTNAYNQRYLESRLLEAAETARRASGRHVSLLRIDIDRYPAILEQTGQEGADRILIEVARIFKKRLRGTDLLFRLADAQFVVLLPDTREDDACHVADQLGVLIQRAQLDSPAGTVRISTGVSALSSSDSIASWTASAQAALSRAQQRGGNRIERRPGADIEIPVLHAAAGTPAA